MISPVIYLGELLSYLDRGEADEVVMQSGQPPRIRVGDEDRTLGHDPLSRDAILAALQGAAVGAVIPTTDTAGDVQIVQIRGRDYLVNIARFLDLFEVRVAGIPAADGEVAKRTVARQPTRRQAQIVDEAPAGNHPTRRERSGVGPLASAAIERTPPDDAGGPIEHPTKREAFGVGPLAAAALGDPRPDDASEPRGDGSHDVSELTAALELDPSDRPGTAPLRSVGTPQTPPARARVPHPAAARVEVAAGSATTPAGSRSSERGAAPPTAASPAAPSARARPEPNASPVPPPAPAPAPDRPRRSPIGLGDFEPTLPDAVADILAAARAEGASDAHLSTEQPVRVRMAGRLEERGILVDRRLLESTVPKILRPHQAAQLAARGHVDLAIEDARAGRLRINLCRQRGGLKLCARLVAATPPTREALGLPAEAKRAELLHQGLVVIAGPSGHGKTTTMAALVDALAGARPIHIITVEDPVEIVHPFKRALVTQREVGTHTKSFAAALSAALREDPDVIAIGEMRDRETVEMALTAAETGHLVLATMNTPSGAKTIERLIELFPPDDQSQVRATLCGALKLVISQRLLPNERTRGLVAAYEVITGGPPLWGLIRDRKLHQLPSLLQRGKAFGMRRLEESLRDLMHEGVISEDTAIRNAEDPRALVGGDPTAGASWNPARMGGR